MNNYNKKSKMKKRKGKIKKKLKTAKEGLNLPRVILNIFDLIYFDTIKIENFFLASVEIFSRNRRIIEFNSIERRKSINYII